MHSPARALALTLALLVPLAAAAAPRTFVSVEEFARAIAMKPGGWHTRFKVTAIKLTAPADLDPATVAAIEAAMPVKVGSVHEQDECAGDTPAGPALPGILLAAECSFSRLEGGDGRWAIASVCPHKEDGGTATIAARGTYEAEKVTGLQAVDLALNGMVVHVEGEMESRYTGQCRPPPAPVTVTVAPPKG